MKCFRCKKPITQYQWTTIADKGRRHLSCPNPNGDKAKRRRKQIERYLQSQSS